jgi:hypothetical protein
MIRRFGPIALLALIAIAAPPAARTQEVATVPAPTLAPAALPAVTETANTPAAQPAVGGPTLDGATIGFHRAAAQTTHGPVTVAATHSSNSAALMIVGGVAFLAGAVISGDAGTIIMIGGAGIGLYGLYLYLQ